MPFTRRSALQTLLALASAPALAQAPDSGATTGQEPPSDSGPPQPNPFSYEDVVRRARDLLSVAFDPNIPPLPEPFGSLGFDAYRDIRFRPDRALLSRASQPFRMQLFHLGFLYQRPVTVNVVREGIPTPVPYQPQLFDFGRQTIERPLPVNAGFAGFRLHYPLNSPAVFDELIAFLGASYFRFLGRNQRYGLSARGLAVNVAGPTPEEFPHFREFWVEIPESGPDRAVVYALLDGESVTGAYRFVVYPGVDTSIDVTATIFPRRPIASLGMAPLTSMYFIGENESRPVDDFRPELHDSDGLLMHSGSGEWIWRPITNPSALRVSSFVDRNPRGFGLMQRDRKFENYEDLEAFYHRRPSYWVEPIGDWGEGQVELFEIPTTHETDDNIVAYWEPSGAIEPGREITISYRLRAVLDAPLHPGGRVVNTFQAPARASGSPEPGNPTKRRFLIDFAGGSLDYYMSEPSVVELVPTTTAGQILRTFVVPNPYIKGFRAAFDVSLPPGQSTELRAYLRTRDKALTETWTYPWTAA